MSPQRCPVFDADSHLIETDLIWEEYLEPGARDAARSAFRLRGDGSVVLNGERQAAAPEPELPRHGLWRPGMSEEDVGQLRAPVALNPGGWDPDARLRDMDAMGIDQALLLPTFFVEYHPLVKDAQLAAALARAYNRWAADLAAAAPERLFPAAVLPQQDAGLAAAELRRAAVAGFRAALLRPVFSGGRFPLHPHYEPLWQAFADVGVAAVLHPSAGPAAPELDANAAFVERVSRAAEIGYPVAGFVAPAMDSAALLVGLLADGLLERHPRLRLLFAHSGVSWVPLALEKAETYLWLSHQEREVSLVPEQLFASRANAVTFRAGDGSVRRMPDVFAGFGAYGSRYPAQDTGDAREALADLERGGVSPALVERLMGRNAAELLGVELRTAA